jgi:PAS domain S-box-containing protein
MKLSEYDDFLRHVFENAPMPIVVMDVEANLYLDFNLAAAKIYGYSSREEAMGKNPLDFSPPTQYDGVSSLEKGAFFVEKALKEGSVVFEWKHKRPGGELWDAEVHLLAFKINDKQLLQFSLIDITERKNTEMLQKMLHDLMLDLNSCIDFYEGLNKVLTSVLKLEYLDCGGIYVADSADNSLSIAAHSGLSKEFASLVSHFEGDSPNVRLALTGEIRYGTYSEIRSGNDPIRQNEGLRAFALIPIMAQGKLIALLNLSSHTYDSVPLASRSILETISFQVGGSLLRLYSENALRESRNRLELAATSAQLGIWDWDITTNKMLWDDQMFRIYGIAEKPATYGLEIWQQRLHPDDAAFAFEECQAAIRGEKNYDSEFRVNHPDGSVKFIKANGIIVRDENGTAVP